MSIVAEPVMQVKTISISRAIMQNINIVFDFLKDYSKTNEASKNIRTKPVFLKGTNSHEMGNEFMFVHKNHQTINVKVKEVRDEDNFFKKIVYQARTEPSDYCYEATYDFYNITEDNSTLVKLYLVYEEIGGIQMNQNQYQTLVNEREDLMQMCIDYLNEYKVKEVSQKESIYIEFMPEKVFYIISEARKFKNSAPDLCESVDYGFTNSEGSVPGDVKKVETKFRIKLAEEMGESVLEVVHSEYVEEENKYIFKLKSSDSDASTVPSQEITFSITKIGEEKCFLEYKTFILDYVSSEYLEILSIKKKEVLKQFRRELRRLSNKEEREDEDDEENVDN